MLRVESVVVKADRLVAVVRVEGEQRRTTPSFMEEVLKRFPDLPGHACVNACGPRFSDVMDHTSLPHLLEHIAIDLQAEEYTRRIRCQGASLATDSPVPLLTGVTKWVDRGEGLAQVQVSYFDDLVALSALQEASVFVNGLLRADVF